MEITNLIIELQNILKDAQENLEYGFEKKDQLLQLSILDINTIELLVQVERIQNCIYTMEKYENLLDKLTQLGYDKVIEKYMMYSGIDKSTTHINIKDAWFQLFQN